MALPFRSASASALCTAAAIVINETEQAVALMLQQHNGMRTYLVGETVGDWQLAPTARVVEFALPSTSSAPRPGLT